jgi:hypothetical protein
MEEFVSIEQFNTVQEGLYNSINKLEKEVAYLKGILESKNALDIKLSNFEGDANIDIKK